MKRMVRCIALISLLLLLLSPAIADQSLQNVSPESVGLSSERLERVSEVLKKEVENGEISGAVGLIMRHGKVAYLKGIGATILEINLAMGFLSEQNVASLINSSPSEPSVGEVFFIRGFGSTLRKI